MSQYIQVKFLGQCLERNQQSALATINFSTLQ